MIDKLSVDAIRILSADAVQKANSGHPGLPLGAAPIAYELWAHNMKHNPKNPNWKNRDRFILSAGHGSSLLYSLLHLFGYGLSIEELKRFRQMGSLTPGHPEYGHTIGVEATTGPLGAGLGMAVGMAMSEAHMAQRFNREGYDLFDHYTFALCGDGCLMEGISSEVMSLAGTLKLHKLIVLYDSNDITIEGNTNLAFTEDVEKRFQSFGFQTINVEDGNNLEEVGKAIKAAKDCKDAPSFIKIKTKIGYGVPAKEGKASAHGEPLGEENVKILRETLGWPLQEAFKIPEEVYENYKGFMLKGEQQEDLWNAMYYKYEKEFPDLKKELDKCYAPDENEALIFNDEYWKSSQKDDATRNVSGEILNKVKDVYTNLLGGSADLGPSNKTVMKDVEDYSKDNYAGRNIHYGVREIGMTAIANGIALYGGLKAYAATFFVFADYMKPMLRLSALMKLPVISILTHDSIGVGEDGPTHEPIEQLAMLRATPGINVFRPADEIETKAAWYCAISSKDTPTCIVLSRQKLKALENSSKEAVKGGYILEKEMGEKPDVILMATGSEVSLAIDAKKKLEEKNISARVVSMPCTELFEQQSDEYKESVLPKGIRKRIAIEAGSSLSWGKYLGTDGAYVTIDTFGASAPADELFKEFGFTVENIVTAVDSII